jgi:hypothetical protein
MDTEIINNPEQFVIDIRGTFNRPGQPPLIYQRVNGTLQKKIGPIIPTNPRSRLQQLNRILFRAAINNAKALTTDQKELYRRRINKKKRSMTWRLQAIKECRKPNRFDVLRFDEGLFFGGIPQRDAWRFDEIAFDDAFMTFIETLPLNEIAVRATYPNINIDSLFPGGE